LYYTFLCSKLGPLLVEGKLKGLKCEGERRIDAAFERWQVTYIQINRKMAPRTFSCAGPTTDQQCKLIEREEKLKITCDRTIGIEGSEMISYRYTPKKSSWAMSLGDGCNLWILFPCIACPSSSVGPSR